MPRRTNRRHSESSSDEEYSGGMMPRRQRTREEILGEPLRMVPYASSVAAQPERSRLPPKTPRAPAPTAPAYTPQDYAMVARLENLAAQQRKPPSALNANAVEFVMPHQLSDEDKLLTEATTAYQRGRGKYARFHSREYHGRGHLGFMNALPGSTRPW